MEKTLEDVRLEADSLGIKYAKNEGVARLQEKIDAWYDAESKANTAPVEVKAEVVEAKVSGKEDPKTAAIRKIKDMEKANLETVIVKVTCVDKREASVATHTYFNTGDVGLNIPLDIFIEIPKILVVLVEDAKAMVHIEQNGETVTKLQKKYVVEYKDR